MNFCLVTAGHDNWPPTAGANACENITLSYQRHLQNLDHSVDIISSKYPADIIKRINSSDYDLVHFQYDDYHYLSKHTNKPTIGTSHYAYLKDPNKWQQGYFHIFKGAFSCKALFSLSNEINNLFIQEGYGGFTRVLRNGVETKLIQFKSQPSKDCLCVGRIEKRKGQAWLAANSEVQIDFVGPIIDTSFKESSTSRYLGVWSREELYEKLSDYKTLVLLSDGEAHPLVTTEALAAGLGIVTTPTAAAHLPLNKSYINIVLQRPENVSEILRANMEHAIKSRSEIRTLAEKFFDYEVVIKEYIRYVGEFLS